MWQTHFLIVLLYIRIEKGAFKNPCDDGNHSILSKGGWRGTACKRTRDESICDRYVEIGNNKWYKVIGHDDTLPRKMAEGSVKMFHCGTDYPLYLPEGSHPSTDGKIVSRNVCMRVGSEECKKQYPVQILKCGFFFLYNLSRPESCDVAYCFGENVSCSEPDPCEEKNRQSLFISGDRSTSCNDKSLKLCDSTLLNNWYRPLMGNVDVKMPTSCVETNRCGTEAPIWLNGEEPSLADKTVNMKACVNMGKTNTCSCDRQINIQVRNCSSYLVYNLTSTPDCPTRYCFGNKGICNEENKDYKQYSRRTFSVVMIVAVVVVFGFIVFLVCMIRKKFFRSSSKIQSYVQKNKEENFSQSEFKSQQKF